MLLQVHVARLDEWIAAPGRVVGVTVLYVDYVHVCTYVFGPPRYISLLIYILQVTLYSLFLPHLSSAGGIIEDGYGPSVRRPTALAVATRHLDVAPICELPAHASACCPEKEQQAGSSPLLREGERCHPKRSSNSRVCPAADSCLDLPSPMSRGGHALSAPPRAYVAV